MVEPLQRTLRAMGGRAYVVVHGGQPWMLDRAEQRLAQLEQLWSRFRIDSDITVANLAAGRPVEVHPDTLAVVARAVDGWRQTAGRFDITMLPALLSHGYRCSAVDQAPAPVVPGRDAGGSARLVVDYSAGTLGVPAGTAIDLGGIGKGFAADLVAEDVMEFGAKGVLVNVGGDIAVLGTPVDETSWYLGIEDPFDVPHHVARLRVQRGGVATSGTTVRRWQSETGATVHHLIDPQSGMPSTSPAMSATVLASDAATAEVFATAAMMMDGTSAAAMLDAAGLAGLIVEATGRVHRSANLTDFES